MSRAKGLTRLAVALVTCLATRALAVDITDCGQRVPPGDTGVLQNDIDCTTSDAIAGIFVGDRATLSLNGHTVIGRAYPYMEAVVGDAARKFTVSGPGVISGADVGISGWKRVAVNDVTLTGNTIGIDVPIGHLKLTNVDVNGNATGISGRTIEAEQVTVNMNSGGDCIIGRNFRGTDVTVTGCYEGVGMLGRVSANRLDDRNNVTTGVSGTWIDEGTGVGPTWGVCPGD